MTDEAVQPDISSEVQTEETEDKSQELDKLEEAPKETPEVDNAKLQAELLEGKTPYAPFYKGAVDQMNKANREKNSAWERLITKDKTELQSLADEDPKLADQIAKKVFNLSLDEALDSIWEDKRKKGQVDEVEVKQKEAKDFDRKVKTGVEEVIRQQQVQAYRSEFVRKNKEFLEKNPDVARELIEDTKIFSSLPGDSQTVDQLERMWSKTVKSNSEASKAQLDTSAAIQGEFARAMGSTQIGGVDLAPKQRDYELHKEWEEATRIQKEMGAEPTPYDIFLKGKGIS